MIDAFAYSFSPVVLESPDAKLPLLGPSAYLFITREGNVHYTYASHPHTGSGGNAIVKDWQVSSEEATRLLKGLVADGLLDLPSSHAGTGHQFTVTDGRWQLTCTPVSMPERIIARLRPYLDKGQAELKAKAPALAGCGSGWATSRHSDRPQTLPSTRAVIEQLLDPRALRDLGQLPLYSDQEAQVFARRAEQLASQILDQNRPRPASLADALAALGIDPRKLRFAGDNVGGATAWTHYDVSEHYRMTVIRRLFGGGFIDGLAITRKQE